MTAIVIMIATIKNQTCVNSWFYILILNILKHQKKCVILSLSLTGTGCADPNTNPPLNSNISKTVIVNIVFTESKHCVQINVFQRVFDKLYNDMQVDVLVVL